MKLDNMRILDIYNDTIEKKGHAIITDIDQFSKQGEDYCTTVSITKYGNRYYVYVIINKAIKIVNLACKIIEDKFGISHMLSYIDKSDLLDEKEELSIIEAIKGRLAKKVKFFSSKVTKATKIMDNALKEEHSENIMSMMNFARRLWMPA